MRQPLARHDFMLENRLFDFLVGDFGQAEIFHGGSEVFFLAD
jgi:hypothetical protein